MQFLKARFHSREEFLKAYAREMPNGGLFIPTTTPIEPGTRVVIDLSCEGLPNKVLFLAKVQSWRPALPRLRVRAGALVAFDAGESDKREFVLQTLGGGARAVRRRKNTRIPVQLQVSYRLAEHTEVTRATMVEISIAGGLLHGPAPLPLKSDLVLSLPLPGGSAAMEIAARVTYYTDEKNMGVRFLFRDGGGIRRLRELIRRIRTT